MAYNPKLSSSAEMFKFYPIYFIMLFITLISCETESERNNRIAREEQKRLELEERREAEEAARVYRLEQERIEREKREEEERIEREARLEEERREKALYDMYINNSLRTGSIPYAYCYGRNSPCSEWGCSEIKVRTPNNSDVMVTIKKEGEVVRHAYIKASSSYTFELKNGTYQPYFY
jgi:hypothetical protein